ncbi:Replication factor C subunit 1 [Holothuria leucospilota]|uniref:Replication factor C subunit 1 n=1 Tax=Holothuria leucospilota TaxID=206669 RepID=A0A9Q0YCY7_HOLLE|nr:Replication factor C subunit 1 [Holothuria leucospilota]
MDIRNYFTPKNGNKRKRDNDGEDDDDFQVTKKKAVKKKSKKGGVIFDSDSDSDDAKTSSKNSAKPLSKTNGSSFKKQCTLQLKKTPSPVKRKEIDVASFFGSSPVQRSNKRTGKDGDQKRVTPKPSVPMELEDHSDEDFQETLEKLDKKNTVSRKNESAASKLANKMRTAKVLAPETPETEPQRRSPRKHIKQETPTKSKKAKAEEVEKAVKKEQTKASPKIEIKHKPVLKESNPKATVQTNKDGGDSAEKKRGGPSYRSYLQREGPRFLGAREFPKGEEGCLEGLSFVFTGVIEYFDKDELKFHIEKLEGAIRTSISKKTSYVIIGREPGEAKTQKAEDLKIKTLDEEGLYKLISSRPGKKKSPPPKTTDSKPAKLPVNVAKPSASSNLKDDSRIKGEEKKTSLTDQFSWTPKSSNTQSQESDSQGSGAYSQESLGRPGPQDVKTEGKSLGSPQMWVDKYKPNSSKQIIGQQGPKSNAKKLTVWLERWQDNNFGTNKERAKFNRDEGFAFKGALLSGPPGVGKTTTAQVVCKELGFTYFELNASDARNKKTLQETVSEYLDNTVLGSFFVAKSKAQDHHNHCLIMDEVDGMSGNEDRGGIQELIQLIKGSRVPVICICNDRSHPKIRSLCNYCFDLRFQRPRLPQIKGAMLSVAFKEGVKIPPQVVENMIMASNQDVRQVLHNMSMWAAGQRSEKTHNETKTGGEPEAVKKDLKMGAWDVVRQVFSSSPEKEKMTFNDKVGLFFHDYSIAPLFVQENYTSVIPHKAKGDIKKHLDLLSKTADSIAMGDLVDRHIRGSMAWKLLPLQAVFASVLPGEYMRGHMGGMINFPSWLGKNSSRGKSHRLLQELQTHMRMSASSSLQSINQEYLPQLRKRLTDPLLVLGSDGTTEVVDLLNSYDLTREDFDNILELTQYSGFKEPMKSVPPKVKAAFTRAFNKSSHLNPYGIDIGTKPKSRKGPPVGFEDQDEIEGDTQEEEEEDDMAAVAKLKVKAKNQPDKTKKGKGPVKGKGTRKGAK